MKFRVMFKTPDAVDDAMRSHGFASSSSDSEEVADEKYLFKKQLKAVTEKFVSYGEYVTLEFDTDTQTCEVLTKGK